MVTWDDHKIRAIGPVRTRQRTFAGMKDNIALLTLLIRAMAGEAFVRQNWPYIAVKIHWLCGGGNAGQNR